MLVPHDPRLIALLDSYCVWTGQSLCSPEALFDLSQPVLAHGTESHPVFWYGNRKALQLWEMSFEDFTQMPSYRTAEPDSREARAALLQAVTEQGFSTGYRGVRVSSQGRRFEIDQATVWNILDPKGQRIGQAATFSVWRMLS